jgi:hypothetical protein
MWVCTDFKGHWPVGVVICAKSRKMAIALLLQELESRGLPQKGVPHVSELLLKDGDVEILNDGEY